MLRFLITLLYCKRKDSIKETYVARSELGIMVVSNLTYDKDSKMNLTFYYVWQISFPYCMYFIRFNCYLNKISY